MNWINIKEQFPEPFRMVMFGGPNMIFTGHFDGKGLVFPFAPCVQQKGLDLSEVSHWSFLPKLPER